MMRKTNRNRNFQVGVFDELAACNCKDKTMTNNILKGVVVLSSNGKNYPVGRVNISNLTQKGKGTSTDDQGKYVLMANPADMITFSHIAMKPKQMLFRDIPPVLVMEENVEELSEVVVTNAPKVSVAPSYNNQLKKAGSWLFWVVVLGCGMWLFAKTDEPKNPKK